VGFEGKFDAAFIQYYIEKGFAGRHCSVVQFIFQTTVNAYGIQISQSIGRIIFTSIGFRSVQILPLKF
jgi:hypothetical protein